MVLHTPTNCWCCHGDEEHGSVPASMGMPATVVCASCEEENWPLLEAGAPIMLKKAQEFAEANPGDPRAPLFLEYASATVAFARSKGPHGFDPEKLKEAECRLAEATRALAQYVALESNAPKGDS